MIIMMIIMIIIIMMIILRTIKSSRDNRRKREWKCKQKYTYNEWAIGLILAVGKLLEEVVTVSAKTINR